MCTFDSDYDLLGYPKKINIFFYFYYQTMTNYLYDFMEKNLIYSPIVFFIYLLFRSKTGPHVNMVKYILGREKSSKSQLYFCNNLRINCPIIM